MDPARGHVGGFVSHSACFVTPSYARDFERCRMLAESRGVCAPDIPHYILVDPQDLPLFRQIAGPQTHVVDAREMIDPSFHKLWGRNGWWFSLSTPPVRGWITQQLRKLAMPRIVDHDILINIDSDVVLIRRFTPDILFDGEGRLGLFEVDYRNAEIMGWAQGAARLTGIAAPTETFNYVGMLIPWWRHQAVALTEAIEAAQGRPWQQALARQKSFSEYMLYGTFMRRKLGLGLEAAAHFPDSRMLVQTSWHKETGSEEGLGDLFASAPESAVGVMVHSKDNVAPADYRRFVERAWAEAAL